jgi:hypothetical protein
MRSVTAPQWNDKGPYKEPTDGDNARVPRLEVDNSDTYLDKDGAGNMTFRDTNTGEVTLADLLAGGVTDHGALTGLEDNDHPQYELAANDAAAAVTAMGEKGNDNPLNHDRYTDEEAVAAIADCATVTTGTFSLLNNTDEQDVIVVAAATQAVDIELDMSNLTQVNTVREYTKVDGANYRQIAAKTFPTDFDSGTKAILLSFTQKDSLYKVTLKASVAEGAARDIPWRQMVRRPI